MIDRTSIAELKQRLDVVSVVSRYFPLKRRGKNFVACCPFHQEKSPSFTVSPERGTFKCFGCGKGGDPIGFVMAHDNLDFVGAVRKLADQEGITLREEARRAT